MTPKRNAVQRRITEPFAKLQALAYQSDAVHALEDREYGALFHEQGLGKTKIAIDLALHWLSTGAVDAVFIVTKNGLISNWRREISKHTNIAPRVLSNDRKSNYYSINSRSRLYLLHYEVFKYESSRIKLMQESRKLGIILDESQKIKNPAAAITEELLKLGPGFARRLIMSGTPVANRPYDIWSQVFFLDHGKCLGDDFLSFKRTFDFSALLEKSAEERDRFSRNLAWLREQLKPFSVRETKGSAGIDLPTKYMERIPCPLEPLQFHMYKSVQVDLSLQVEKNGVLLMESTDDVLKRLLRLVQVASNPKLLDERYNAVPGKLVQLRALLKRIMIANTKAIVWTTFVATAEWLTLELEEYNPRCINGHMTMPDRDASIASFLEDDSVQILVATTGAAKEGLTLTVANHAIFFDRSFSLDDFLQAQDRIHRISQTKECFIYVLVARGTIDEWVDLLIDSKRYAAQLAQGDISKDEYLLNENYGFYGLLKKMLAGDEHHG